MSRRSGALTYRHTLTASYFGYITQAIVNNLAPLLFLILQDRYGIPLSGITLLVTVNFAIQLLVDLLSARYVDRIGYRRCIVAAHFLAAAGLIGLSVWPELLPDPYAGLMISVFLYAVGGGLIEVLVSPIVEACPTENKASVMSLLHSFYCWGTVGVILISTGFLAFAGKANWRLLPVFWAVLPLANAFFYAKVPIGRLTEENRGMTVAELGRNGFFWIFVLLMVTAGASEQAMSQWASAFAEKGLGISKAMGDLAGPCVFSILMGLSRVWYARFGSGTDLTKAILVCGVLCACSYPLASLAPGPVLALAGCGLCGLSVGIMWPGVFSLASAQMPRGGTALFALLALAGDLGCSGGPTLVGMISSACGDELHKGLLAAVIFPLLLVAGMAMVRHRAPRA